MIKIDKKMNDNNLKDLSLSNYPIFLALILTIASPIILSMVGDESIAEHFAIYAYYLFVIGIIIRLFEFIIPESIITRTINEIKNLPEFRKIEQFIKNIFNQQYFPIILYLSISLLIYLNINRGYILVLDMIFPIKNSLYFSYPSPIIGGSWIIERIYLLFAIFLSGYSMYNLSCRISKLRIISLYAGLLYMINPFTYIRILAGHLLILLSYATIPLLLMTFIDFLDRKANKEMIKFIFILSLVAFSLHIFVIALIIIGILFLFWLDKHRDIRISKIFILCILFVLLNLYWIIPVTTSKNMIIGNIEEKDFETFSPTGDLFDIASMHGFWKEGYLYAKDFLSEWQIIYSIILLLSIIGFISYYKDKKIGVYVKSFAVIGIVGIILASGVNGPLGDTIMWLFNYTILKGFRDSQKFVAMIVLSYSILGTLGISKIEEKLK